VGEQVLTDPEARQVGLWQIDPAADVVLADITDEVGQLEGLAQRGRPAQRIRTARTQQRGHQLADDRRAAPHVAAELLPGGVSGDRQVHDHRVEELLQQIEVKPKPSHRVPGRSENGVFSRIWRGRGSH